MILNTIIILPTLNQSATKEDPMQVYDFNEDWMLTTSSNPNPISINLPYLVEPAVGYDEWITIENTIPSLPFQQMELFTTVFQKNFNVYIDNQEVYSYSPNVDGISESPGSGNFIIELGTLEAGQKITIRFQNKVTTDLSRIQAISLFQTSGSNELLHFYPPLFFFSTLTSFILGTLLIMSSFNKTVRNYNFANLFLIGAFLIVGAFWISCNSKLLQLFTDNLLLIHKLELSSYYLLPLLLWGIIYTRWKELRTYVLPIYLFMTMIYLAFLFVDAINLVDIGRMLTFFTRLGYLNIIYLFVLSIVGFRKKVETYQYFMVGIVFFVIVMFLDLSLHFSYSNKLPVPQFLLYGILIFGTVMFFSFLNGLDHHQKEIYKEQILYEASLVNPKTHYPSRYQLALDASRILPNTTAIYVSLDSTYEYLMEDGYPKFDEQLALCTKLITSSIGNKGNIYQLENNLFAIIIDQPHLEFIPFMMDTIEQSFRNESQIVIDYTISTSLLANLHFEDC